MSPQEILSFIATFTAAFLSGFFTAIPFLLLGGLASGLVAVFVREDDITRALPGQKLLIPLTGALLGLVFPVGQVGAIPLARRMFRKGLPLSAVMAFLVAGPVVNLVTAASTYAAYGTGPILYARIIVGLIMGVGIGLLFAHDANENVLKPVPTSTDPVRQDHEDWRQAMRRAARLGGDEVFDIGRYLVVGTILVALLQTLVPASVLSGLNTTPAGGVAMMGLLALIQSPEPAVEAFLSLLYAPGVSVGAVLTYLAPITDLQGLVVMLAVFRAKIPVYLLVLTTLFAVLIGLFVTFNLPW